MAAREFGALAKNIAYGMSNKSGETGMSVHIIAECCNVSCGCHANIIIRQPPSSQWSEATAGSRQQAAGLDSHYH